MRKISLNGNKLIPKYDVLTKCQEKSVLDQHEVLEKNGYNQLGFEAEPRPCIFCVNEM